MIEQHVTSPYRYKKFRNGGYSAIHKWLQKTLVQRIPANIANGVLSVSGN